MGLRDKLGAVTGKLRSFMLPVGVDHPSNGGITGDLDPEDWPDEESEGTDNE